MASVSPSLKSLSFCPLDKKLNIASITPFPASDYVFKYFFEHVCKCGKDSPFLRNLQNVYFLRDSDFNYYFSVDLPYDIRGSLDLLAQLPALKSIHIDGVNDFGFGDSKYMLLPPRSANYTNIIIRNSTLRYSCLVDTIVSAKALEGFTYSVGPNNARETFSPDLVFLALFQHRDHLQKLDLDVEYTMSRFEIYFKCDLKELVDGDDNLHLRMLQEANTPPSLHPTCSVRKFSRLKSLSLGIRLFYYLMHGSEGDRCLDPSFSIAENLPLNLEFLCIYGYKKGSKPHTIKLPRIMEPYTKFFPDAVIIDEQLSKLIAEKDEKLPRLKHIVGIDECVPGATIKILPGYIRNLRADQ